MGRRVQPTREIKQHPVARGLRAFPARLAGAASEFFKGRAGQAIERAAENHLLGQKELHRLALEVANVGTWEYNLKTHEVVGDERAQKIFGVSTARLSFEKVIEVTHPSDRQVVRQGVQAVLQPDSPGHYQMEHRVVFPDLSVHWVRVRGQVYFGSNGGRRAMRFIGTVLDITEAKEAEQAALRVHDELTQVSRALETVVEQRTTELRQTISELEQFSHALVHDLRAPLRAMESYAFLLHQELKANQSARVIDYVERIRASSRRLDHLVLDALSYSQATRAELHLVPIDLEHLLCDMVISYPDLDPHRAEIQIVRPIPKVMANIAGLTQCFSNLLDNAVKFVPPGTKPRVVVRADRSAALCRIWVEDNGIGIRKESIPHLFGLFRRLDSKYEGTGLGLAIVRKVVGQMGGNVGVESEPGQGSRFWVELQPAEE